MQDSDSGEPWRRPHSGARARPPRAAPPAPRKKRRGSSTVERLGDDDGAHRRPTPTTRSAASTSTRTFLGRRVPGDYGHDMADRTAWRTRRRSAGLPGERRGRRVAAADDDAFQ